MTLAAEPTPPSKRSSRWTMRLVRADKWLSRTSEWLNPILIKEARQSLKSRQFVLTFGLLLIAVWGWTALSVTTLQSRGVHGNASREVFSGYFLILEVPLLLIVPFSAFRSLASEREDGTYELVSITTLGARQIVLGKLSSALLQVMVYFSIIAPCLAFTYMLRGIDLLTIGVTLVYTLIFSVSLICVGLMLAASVRSIHWQILSSVAVLGALTLVTFVWPAFVFDELLRRGMPFDDPDFWHFNGFVLAMIVSLSALFLAATTAELSFPSDNRSTKLRIHMLVVQAVFTGWMLFMYLDIGKGEIPIIMSLFVTGYWMVMGGMMTGERPELSPRVRRSLPKSFLGRMAFTWFNPGSGSGYVFAVTNALGVFLAVVVIDTFASSNKMRFNEMTAAGLAVSYLAIYLGIGRLLLLALRKISDFGVVVAFMIQALVAVLGTLIPILMHTILHWNQPGFRYTWLQLPNWGLTLSYALDRRGSFSEFEYWMAVHATALVVLVLNLVLAAKELQQLREETPDRVLEEDRELLGAQPEPAAPRSPFDD